MGNATESTLPHGNTSGYDRKPAGHAPVPPVMSRSSATDAVPVRISHGN